MNRLGAAAKAHWQTHLPNRTAKLGTSTAQDAFFAQMGERLQQEVNALENELAGADTPGEGYLEKMGRLQNARRIAESEVLREQVLSDTQDLPNPPTLP